MTKLLRRLLYFSIGFVFVLIMMINLPVLISFHVHRPMKSFTRFCISHFSGIDETTRINDLSPIQYAVYAYDNLKPEQVKDASLLMDLFLSKKVSIETRDSFGATALYRAAAFEEDPLLTKILIERGADVNSRLTGEEMADTKNMTMLAFIKGKKEKNLVKNPEALAQVEQLLITAGATE